MPYSVLMSVYYKEHPANLRQAMQSIYNQTVPTDDFVLVCDGPLTPSLDNVIQEMEEIFGPILHIIRLEQNRGLGHALNLGMKYCRNELIARMDSDDISYPDRCEKQLQIFRENAQISICSGIVEEFSSDIHRIDARRIPPETQEEIIKFSQKRNPFNHPCVMYKKSAVEASGGYQDFYLLEDYYLWLRMLMNGFYGYNIQQPLLYMRAGSELFKRRSGFKYFQAQKKLLQFMRQKKYISDIQYIGSLLSRFISSFLPNCLRKRIYKLVLRG